MMSFWLRHALMHFALLLDVTLENYSRFIVCSKLEYYFWFWQMYTVHTSVVVGSNPVLGFKVPDFRRVVRVGL